MSAVKLIHSNDTVPIVLSRQARKVPLADYIAEKCPSIVGPEAVFHATPYLFNGHLQTGYASVYSGDPVIHTIPYQRELLSLADDGHVTLDWTPPLAEKPLDDTPTLVCLHGLTGGSHESYIRALLTVITQAPYHYRAVVMNCRGCAESEIKTPQLFNGAYTDDLKAALAHIQRSLAPGTPLMGIGFSLGSNILVKYLGEEGDKAPFCAAVSVANPFDFKRSSQLLESSYFSRKVYSAAMASNLKKVYSRHLPVMANSDTVDPDVVMASQTLRQFDDACTRRMFHYASVDDYYHDASSSRVIASVRVPLLCVNALDDPIAQAECIPYDEIKSNPNVVLATTDTGGHLGWFEHILQPTRWVVKPLSEFIVAMFEANMLLSSENDISTAASTEDAQRGTHPTES